MSFCGWVWLPWILCFSNLCLICLLRCCIRIGCFSSPFGTHKDTTGALWFKPRCAFHISVNGLCNYVAWRIPGRFGVSATPYVIIHLVLFNTYLLAHNHIIIIIALVKGFSLQPLSLSHVLGTLPSSSLKILSIVVVQNTHLFRPPAQPLWAFASTISLA